MDRQLTQIGNEGLYERRLHISVHRSLVGKRLNEVQHRFVIGIDGYDARPSQRFDIWAQLDHTPGKLGLLTRLCLEPDIDMNRLGHLVLSDGHRSSAEAVSVGASEPSASGNTTEHSHEFFNVTFPDSLAQPKVDPAGKSSTEARTAVAPAGRDDQSGQDAAAITARA